MVQQLGVTFWMFIEAVKTRAEVLMAYPSQTSANGFFLCQGKDHSIFVHQNHVSATKQIQ
jgi:hypothetical protein